MNSAPSQLEKSGYAVLPRCVSAERLASLRGELDSALSEAGRRNLLGDSPAIAEFAATELAAVVQPFASADCFPVRAILFDKTPQTNWKVAWHQDEFIAVSERREVEGFAGWSLKEGVWHTQAPVSVLERMLTVRLHLDDCGADQGPLRVLPGSHLAGRLDAGEIAAIRNATPAEEIHCRAGDALLMRPLLLHASSKATQPARRRVLHVEFACDELPVGLNWAHGRSQLSSFSTITHS